MENERIYIYKKVEALAESVGSLYRDTRKCRDDLLNFFIANEWFGQKLEGNGDDIYIRNSAEITERLCLWLMAYRRTDSEKTDLLLERFSISLLLSYADIAARSEDEVLCFYIRE